MALGPSREDLPELEALEVRIRGLAALVAALHKEDYWWQTDHRGVFALGYNRKRFVAWDHIAGAKSTDDSYILSSTDIELVVPLKPAASMFLSDKLAASLWQHLRRVGLAEDIDLPKAAETFWTDIAESVPREIEWKKGFFRFRMTDDYFEVRKFLCHRKVEWKHVTFARWSRIGLKSRGILIGSSRPRSRTTVPYIPDDKVSRGVILALIRRLRTAGQPQAIPIPAELLSG